jgi:hypothetical protein
MIALGVSGFAQTKITLVIVCTTLISCTTISNSNRISFRMPTSEDDPLPKEIQSCLTKADYPVLKSNCLEKYSCVPSEFVRCDRVESGKLNPVSILSLATINEILNEASKFKYVNYQYLEGACYNRGQNLSLHLYLRDKKVFTGQIYLEGAFNYNGNSWGMHTAPYVYLKSGTEIKRVILDPAIIKNEVVDEAAWVQRFASHANDVSIKEYHASLYLFSSDSTRVSYSYSELPLDFLRAFKLVQEHSLESGSAK